MFLLIYIGLKYARYYIYLSKFYHKYLTKLFGIQLNRASNQWLTEASYANFELIYINNNYTRSLNTVND